MIKYKKLKKLLIWTCKQKKVGGSQLPSATRMAEFEENEPVPSILLPCTSCNRTFRPEALAKHSQVCEKSLMKKRKKFDSSKQRLQGTELAAFPPVVSKPTPTKKDSSSPYQVKLKERQQVELTKTLLASRKRNEAVAKAAAASLVKPTDHDQCPYCQRHFGPKAFDRHTEWCKEQQNKIKNSNINLEAKERLQVRTKYRAPLTSKVLTRDKYNPRSRDPSPASRDSNNMPSPLSRSSSQRLSTRSKTVVVNNVAKRQEYKPTTSSVRCRSETAQHETEIDPLKSPAPPKILSAPIQGKKKKSLAPSTSSSFSNSPLEGYFGSCSDLSHSLIVQSCALAQEFESDEEESVVTSDSLASNCMDYVERLSQTDSDEFDAGGNEEDVEIEFVDSEFVKDNSGYRRRGPLLEDIYNWMFLMSVSEKLSSRKGAEYSEHRHTSDEDPSILPQVPPGYVKIVSIAEINDASTHVNFCDCACDCYSPVFNDYVRDRALRKTNCSSIAIQCCYLKKVCFFGVSYNPCTVDSDGGVHSKRTDSDRCGFPFVIGTWNCDVALNRGDIYGSSNADDLIQKAQEARNSLDSLIKILPAFDETSELMNYLIDSLTELLSTSTSRVGKHASTQTPTEFNICSACSSTMQKDKTNLITWADLARKSRLFDDSPPCSGNEWAITDSEDSQNAERITLTPEDSLTNSRDSLSCDSLATDVSCHVPEEVKYRETIEYVNDGEGRKKIKTSFYDLQSPSHQSWCRDSGKVKLKPIPESDTRRLPQPECSRRIQKSRNAVLLPPLKSRRSEWGLPQIVRHVVAAVLPKRLSLKEDEAYDPFASAEQQLLELLGIQPVKLPSENSLQTQPETPQSPPVSAFALYAPVKNSDDLSPDLVDAENKENNNSSGGISPLEPTPIDIRKQFSLSSLSLCSIVSLDSIDCNRNLGPGKYYKNKDDGLQRSFSATDGKSKHGNRVKVNMHQMLYGSNSPQIESPRNVENNGNGVENLQACEAELLASMMEFEKMLNSSPPPLISTMTPSETLPSTKSPESIKKDSTEESTEAKQQHAPLSIDSAYGSLTRGAGDAPEFPRNEIARFCHECGSKYPVPSANFCCNCGVRRVII